MKQQLINKSIVWIKTYLVTTVLTIISFSFVTSEWKVIYETGKQMFEVARPIAEKMMMQI
ncbi:hypothetical protein CAP36_07200 [Chitinophagaceae bacterium IBVUCB2]|nr:hypothetical protein CAP36_07200 [Chitinophagaceae bacterium IBVUCB2]